MAGAHQLSARMTWLAATRLRPTLQTAREASRICGLVGEGVEKEVMAASRAGERMEPSMRVKGRERAVRAVPMMSRKEVHWLKMTVLVVGSLVWEAWRMESKASTLLLELELGEEVVGGLRDSPRSMAGWTRESEVRGSARHMGQRCWVSMTRVMQSAPN